MDPIKLSKNALDLLTDLVVNQPPHFVSKQSRQRIVTEGLAILDTEGECPNTPDGMIAIRATEKGVAYFNEHVASASSYSQVIPKISTVSEERANKMEIDIDVPMPTKGTTRRPQIDLEALPVGGSYHFPVTEKRPDPEAVAKSKQGTVTARNGRYRTQVGVKDDGKPEYEWSMRWAVRPVGMEDPKGPGARIFRIL